MPPTSRSNVIKVSDKASIYRCPNILQELQPHITTLCRVTRHRMTTSTHDHGKPAETKPASTIRTQRVKIAARNKYISSAALRYWQEQFQPA